MTVNADSLSNKQNIKAIFLLGLLFFVFGFATWINAILIPYFKIACELSNFQSYLVAFAFYISYFIMSIPASYLLKRVGFKKGMMIGFWFMALGAFVFIPAALQREYGIFLAGLFTIGVGLAILQTASNPYVTILGPKESAAQRFSIMGICNKMAGIIAPLVFASVVLKQTDNEMIKQLSSLSEELRNQKLDEFIRRVIWPYTVVGIILTGFSFLVRYSSLPEIDTEKEDQETASVNSTRQYIIQFPHLILGAFAIFFHVGAQVIAVDTIIGYAGSMNVSLLEAKVFPSYTLFAQICGYILGILLIPKYLKQVNALRICTLLGIIFSLLILFTQKQVVILGHKTDVSLWFVVLLGFANSMIWAGIWPLAMDGLGRFIKIGASLLIMGLVGNAIMPLVYGYLGDKYGLRDAYWILLPCYLYLVFYAFYGYKIRRWNYKMN